MQPLGGENIINKFIGKTILVNNLMEKSQFGKLRMEYIRTNFKKKSLTITMKTKEKMEELCKVTKIGDLQ